MQISRNHKRSGFTQDSACGNKACEVKGTAEDNADAFYSNVSACAHMFHNLHNTLFPVSIVFFPYGCVPKVTAAEVTTEHLKLVQPSLKTLFIDLREV